MRIAAGSRPTRAAASSTASRTAAMRARTSAGKESGLRERAGHLDEREPDPVRQGAVDAFDEAGAESLDGVSARLAVRLAGVYVGPDRPRIEWSERHPGDDDVRRPGCSLRREERESRRDTVLPPGEK